jgi:hypothetical protein
MTDWDFAGLRAVFINCTLKKSPEPSHTQGLVDASAATMREHGWEMDAWPEIYPRVIKHCAQNILYSLQHLGYTVPPNADAGWIGEAGPGPSYLDPGSGGPENDFTNRNTTFLTWNLMHLAKMLRDAGGVPGYGNVRSAWDDGARFDFENPEYR